MLALTYFSPVQQKRDVPCGGRRWWRRAGPSVLRSQPAGCQPRRAAALRAALRCPKSHGCNPHHSWDTALTAEGSSTNLGLSGCDTAGLGGEGPAVGQGLRVQGEAGGEGLSQAPDISLLLY